MDLMRSESVIVLWHCIVHGRGCGLLVTISLPTLSKWSLVIPMMMTNEKEIKRDNFSMTKI